MKISELSTGRALDVLCEVTPYITEIASDEALVSEIRKEINPKDAKNRLELLHLAAKKMNKIVPLIFAKNKHAVLGILAVLNEKGIEEYEKQNVLVTMKEILIMSYDKDLIDFFKSCMDMVGGE